MALAENTHHCSRGQTNARAGRGAREVLHRRIPEDAAPPQAAGARYFAMDAGEDVGETPAVGRPAPLLEVLPQERVQRRTVEQIVDPVPVVPMLFTVESQMVDQLVDFSHTSRFRRCGAGYRCAQDCVSTPRCSHSPPCTVVGGTADGSADDRFLFFLIAADYGAER